MLKKIQKKNKNQQMKNFLQFWFYIVIFGVLGASSISISKEKFGIFGVRFFLM